VHSYSSGEGSAIKTFLLLDIDLRTTKILTPTRSRTLKLTTLVVLHTGSLSSSLLSYECNDRLRQLLDLVGPCVAISTGMTSHTMPQRGSWNIVKAMNSIPRPTIAYPCLTSTQLKVQLSGAPQRLHMTYSASQ
jgi:hypothetical protein